MRSAAYSPSRTSPGTGNKVTFSPVKEYALSQGLTVYQPVKMRDGTALEIVKSLSPELIVVVAYGRILPKDILDVPPLGCVNVHASLLPKYRGAAPINWAMLNGDAETGVSIMYMAEELDAGDVIRTVKTPIDPEEDLPGPLEPAGGTGGGSPVCNDSHVGGGHRLPDAAGRQSGHLCPHAVPGTVSH